MIRKKEILIRGCVRNQITSVAAFYKIPYGLCAAILLGPTLQGTYSGRQNIYGYFHGIFSRNSTFLFYLVLPLYTQRLQL